MKLLVSKKTAAIVTIFMILLIISCGNKPYVDVYMKITPDFETLERKTGDTLDKSEKDEYVPKFENELKEFLLRFKCKNIVIKKADGYVFEITYKTNQQEIIKKYLSQVQETSLFFRFVDDRLTEKVMEWYKSNIQDQSFPEDRIQQQVFVARIVSSIELPENREILFVYKSDKNGEVYPSDLLVLHKSASLDGGDILKADLEKDEISGTVISFITTADGAGKLYEITKPENYGKRLAIVFNNQVKSAPFIREQIVSGRGNISGAFTRDERDVILNIFRENSKYLTVRILEEKTNLIKP